MGEAEKSKGGAVETARSWWTLCCLVEPAANATAAGVVRNVEAWRQRAWATFAMGRARRWAGVAEQEVVMVEEARR